MDALESLQGDHRLRHRREFVAQVELHHLVAGATTAVANRRADVEPRRAERYDLQRAVLERGVAQAVPERKERLAGEIGVVVTAAGGEMQVGKRQLALTLRHREGQAAGGVDVAEEHLAHRSATGLAGVPRVHDGPDPIDPWPHRHGAATHHDHRHRSSGRGDGADERLLCAGQRQ